MAISLQRFNAGDLDYVAKLNTDIEAVETAINDLETAMGSSLVGVLSPLVFLSALFKGVTTLIGAESYKPIGSGTTLSVAVGAAYKASNQSVVQATAMTISFVGAAANTYYVVPSIAGPATRELTDTDALYSVVWTGSAFGAITQIAPAIFDAVEETAARVSTILATTYASLDARLEAGEGAVAAKVTGPGSSIDNYLAVFNGTSGKIIKSGGPKPTRKVGLTLDGGGAVISTGVKGAIQVDFAGTLIGWSIVADQAGDITIEIDKKTSSAPPSAPAIPNTTTDKISASAPVSLAAAQSGAVAAAGVSTWTTAVAAWDVIQFNVTAVVTLQRATLYLTIQPS